MTAHVVMTAHNVDVERGLAPRRRPMDGVSPRGTGVPRS